MSIRDRRPTANGDPHLSREPAFNDKVTLKSIHPEQLDSAAKGKLRQSIRPLLRRHDDERAADEGSSKHQLTEALWRALGDIFREAGLGAIETGRLTQADWELLSVAAEEFGRVPVDVPFLTSAVVAATIARRVAWGGLAARLMCGASTAAFLTPYEQPIRAVSAGSMHSGRVWAEVPAVAGATRAQTLMMLCGDKLVSFDREWAEMTPAGSVDDTRELVNVKVSGAHATVLAEADRALYAVASAADGAGAVLALEQAALADMCYRLVPRTAAAASQHHRDREMIAIEKAGTSARYAVECLAAEDPHAGIAVSAAQVVCSTVSFRAARTAARSTETHSHATALLLERARGNALAFGGPLWHRRRLAHLSTAPIPVGNPSL